jgi:hypothetical protein
MQCGWGFLRYHYTQQGEEAMETFIVFVREVHIQPVTIEADTPEDAIQRVADGQGHADYDMLEYSHTLDPETWTVVRAKPLKSCV